MALESTVKIEPISELSEPNNINDGVIQKWPRRYHGIFDVVMKADNLKWTFRLKDRYIVGCVIVYFADSKYVVYSNEQHEVVLSLKTS